MGIRTVIGSQGVVISRVDGSDEVNINSISKRTIMVVSESGNASITNQTTLFRPMNAAGVTGSLPEVSDANVGTEYLVLKNSGSNPLLLSGTCPIVGSPGTAVGLWKCAVSASAGRYTCLAVSGSTGYMWFVGGPTF